MARTRTLYRGTAVHTWLDQWTNTYVKGHICGWTDVRKVRCVAVVLVKLRIRNDLHIR